MVKERLLSMYTARVLEFKLSRLEIIMFDGNYEFQFKELKLVSLTKIESHLSENNDVQAILGHFSRISKILIRTLSSRIKLSISRYSNILLNFE